ncbi:MAG: replication-relaxation family protein [Deltaproteobacteria bacterium]|nr:replication-relaxation family protein [Deltaproteobacteria bacterium]
MTETRTSRTGRQKQIAVIVERDFKILYTVGRFGLASTRHLSALYFRGINNTAHKRLRTLFNAGFLEAHVLLGSTSSTLYTLTLHGRKALAERYALEDELLPIPRTLDVADLKHRLAVLDVRVALVLATRMDPALRLVHFFTGGEVMHITQPAGFRVIPDALVLVEKDNQSALHLLEVDLGTEPLSVWEKKARGYAEALRFQTPLLDQSTWRILIVAPGTTRLTAIAKVFSMQIQVEHFRLLDLSTLTPETFLNQAWGSYSTSPSNTDQLPHGIPQ